MYKTSHCETFINRQVVFLSAVNPPSLWHVESSFHNILFWGKLIWLVNVDKLMIVKWCQTSLKHFVNIMLHCANMQKWMWMASKNNENVFLDKSSLSGAWTFLWPSFTFHLSCRLKIDTTNFAKCFLLKLWDH